jgi:hypothetical protein
VSYLPLCILWQKIIHREEEEEQLIQAMRSKFKLGEKILEYIR